jgi:hypothetical protein
MATGDMVIVFSGFRDNELSKQISAKLNARVISALSKNATHLVVKDTPKGSDKIEKAKEMGMTIISLEDFMKEHDLTKTEKVKKPRVPKTKEISVEEYEESLLKEEQEEAEVEADAPEEVENTEEPEAHEIKKEEDEAIEEIEEKEKEEEEEEEDKIDEPIAKKAKRTRKSKNPEIDDLKKRIADMTQELKALKAELKEKRASA